LKELQENDVDHRAQLYRALSGLIPGGSFFAEYAVQNIPGLRFERVIDYVQKLDARIKKLESHKFASDERFGLLIENSILEAAKSHSSKRRSWLATLVTPVVDPPSTKEWDLRLSCVGKLSDLSDTEVEYLLGYMDPKTSFQQEHMQDGGSAFISSGARTDKPDQELFDMILNNNHKQVHRLSLAKHGFLEFDDDGSFKRYVLTDIGKLFIYLLTDKMVR